MTKMAAMPIYDKTPLKIFFSGTIGQGPRLGMQNWGLNIIKQDIKKNLLFLFS